MKRQILAVDDSKAIRFLLQTVFGRSYQVTTASDGCSAMYWLTKNKLPDIIIADPQLPDMQDWELIDYLTSSGIYGSVPLVVLSALDKKETQQRCKELEVEKYFMKPFNPVDLEIAIESLTSFRVKRREAYLKVV